MGRKRPYITPEFKAEAVELLESSNKSVQEVAKDIGVSYSALRRWQKQANIDAGKGPSNALTTTERQELMRLRRELRQTRMERDFLKKTAVFFAKESSQAPYQVINALEGNFPLTMMCRQLEVSRSGYYAWKHRKPTLRNQADSLLTENIKKIHSVSRGTYGSPRILAKLKERGFNVGRRRVARLMKENDITGVAPRPFKCTTNSKHNLNVAENVLGRKFNVDAPDKAWVTDVTYIRTWQGFDVFGRGH